MKCAINYRNWIFARFRPYLGQRIIEVGAGIGNNTEMLLDRGLVVATDIHAACVQHMRSRFPHHENVVPLRQDISDPAFLDLARFSPDTVVCINVLEHIEHDAVALTNMHTVLQDGGKVLLFVPAYRILYGSIDRLVGHHRRYGKKELILKMTRAGFAVREIYYMNSIGVFGWFLNNRILKKSEESVSQVRFFDRYVIPLLSAAEHIVKPPFGLSLLAIGEKEGRSEL